MTSITRTWWTAGVLLLIAAAGCGKKDDDARAKAPDPAPAAAPDAAAKAPPPEPGPGPAPSITPRQGETFGGDDVGIGVTGANPVMWKAGGATVALGVLFPGGAEEKGRIVVASADAAGKVTETEVETIEMNMAYGHDVEIVVGADGKALVRVGESGGSGDPGFGAAWRLAWDAAAGRAVIEQKDQWTGIEDPPAWVGATAK